MTHRPIPTDMPSSSTTAATPAVAQRDTAAPAVGRRRFLQLGALGGTLAAALPLTACGGGSDEITIGETPLPSALFADERRILSEPLLQNPGADSVRVIWFSEFETGRHSVRVGENLQQEFVASTSRMTHMLEDAGSQVFQLVTGTWATPRERRVFRHEALVTGLPRGERVPYTAVSEFQGQSWRSGRYTLRSLPRADQGSRILLTSDHQNNPMCSANMQKMAEVVGIVDAVLFPGDFVSQPNRASEWFDRAGGGGNANLVGNPSFFQSLQGTARRWNPGSPYTGAPVLQHAPLYGCMGNHEYPGRWRMDPATNNANNPEAVNINAMDNDPQPRWYAQARYEELAATVNPSGNPALRERWIEDNSYEWTTYREMWSLPEGPEGRAYYAQRFGDVFIISIDANRVWRGWTANQRGKFTERFIDAQRRVTTNTDEWGFGDINFRPFGRGSRQYAWLQEVLQSEACRTARLRIVMSHQTMAGLGDNAVPVQAEIRSTIELIDGSTIGPFPASEWPLRWPTLRPLVNAGQVRYVKHDYPKVTECTIWRRRTSATPSARCSSPPPRVASLPARGHATAATCRAVRTGWRRPVHRSPPWAISPEPAWPGAPQTIPWPARYMAGPWPSPPSSTPCAAWTAELWPGASRICPSSRATTCALSACWTRPRRRSRAGASTPVTRARP